MLILPSEKESVPVNVPCMNTAGNFISRGETGNKGALALEPEYPDEVHSFSCIPGKSYLPDENSQPG